MLEIHPHDAEARGIEDGDWVGIASRAGETVLRAVITEGCSRASSTRRSTSRSRRQRRHDRELRLGDQLPRVQGDGGAGRQGQRIAARGSMRAAQEHAEHA